MKFIAKLFVVIITCANLFLSAEAFAALSGSQPVGCMGRGCTVMEMNDWCGYNVTYADIDNCTWYDWTGSGPDQCDNGTPCTCKKLQRTFWYNVGCVCNNGYYGAAGDTNCSSCPNNGSSDLANNYAITSCYKVVESHDAAAHATVKQTCKYSTSTSSYTDCLSLKTIVSCDAGYYRVNTTDSACTAVGSNYYSISPFARSLCPTYTNPSGGTSYGQTAGGTEADANTDCRIPMSEVYSDTTGSWVYDPYCKYTS